MKPFEERIKCLVVEPGKRPTVQVIDNTLEAKQQLVGGLIEVVSLSDTAELICNEEGKLIGLPANRIVGEDVIAGTFLVVGCEWDNEHFVSLSEADIAEYSSVFHSTLLEQIQQQREKMIEELLQTL